jgi:hypothetical protein
MSSDGTAHPSVARLDTDVIGSHEFNFRSWDALPDKTMSNELIEGHESEA